MAVAAEARACNSCGSRPGTAEGDIPIWNGQADRLWKLDFRLDHMQSSSEFEVRLSKSRFVAGVQCLKRLYLQVYEPGLSAEPDEATDAILSQGTEVGAIARCAFPGGVTVDAGYDEIESALENTRK